MPEGDTVWLTCRRLDRALAGRVLTESDFRVPALATVDLRGVTVTEVLPRGKHILTRFNDGRTLHSHLRMDGSWRISRIGDRPRWPAHAVRALVGNAEWRASGLNVHDLTIVARDEEDRLVGHLGPDVLGPDWSPEEVVRRLLEHPSRPIGEALLDQRNLAGVGNLYKSEVLYLNGINPWTAAGDVSGLLPLLERARRLMHANREHPEQSTTGSLRLGDSHWVYRRRGEPCRRCGTPIRAVHQGVRDAERSTYWCPNCQPADGTPADGT